MPRAVPSCSVKGQRPAIVGSLIILIYRVPCTLTQGPTSRQKKCKRLSRWLDFVCLVVVLEKRTTVPFLRRLDPWPIRRAGALWPGANAPAGRGALPIRPARGRCSSTAAKCQFYQSRWLLSASPMPIPTPGWVMHCLPPRSWLQGLR